jgi:hypothetical protein
MITAILAGALFAGSPYPPPPSTTEPPNPGPQQCVVVAIDTERIEPTYLDPEGQPVGMRMVLLCGTPGGLDELKILTIDVDTAELLADFVEELLEDD